MFASFRSKTKSLSFDECKENFIASNFICIFPNQAHSWQSITDVFILPNIYCWCPAKPIERIAKKLTKLPRCVKTDCSECYVVLMMRPRHNCQLIFLEFEAWLVDIKVSVRKISKRIEPPHDKTNKMTCAPSEDRSVWASARSDQTSLSAWRKFGSFATHWAHSEDSDKTGWMPRLIWVFAGRTVILLVLSWAGSITLCLMTQHGDMTINHKSFKTFTKSDSGFLSCHSFNMGCYLIYYKLPTAVFCDITNSFCEL